MVAKYSIIYEHRVVQDDSKVLVHEEVDTLPQLESLLTTISIKEGLRLDQIYVFDGPRRLAKMQLVLGYHEPTKR